MAASLRAPYFDPNTNMRYDTNNADFEGMLVGALRGCFYVGSRSTHHPLRSRGARVGGTGVHINIYPSIHNGAPRTATQGG